VDPGEEVYIGQIIAENIKPGDLVVNATEGKKLTNHRASGSDDATRIAPKTQMTAWKNVWSISSRMNVSK
jgi:GTP-binding protein